MDLVEDIIALVVIEETTCPEEDIRTQTIVIDKTIALIEGIVIGTQVREKRYHCPLVMTFTKRFEDENERP